MKRTRRLRRSLLLPALLFVAVSTPACERVCVVPTAASGAGGICIPS